MRQITTGDLIENMILKARIAEKCRLISMLHPTGANASATRKADRALRAAREALNRHFHECLKIVQKERKQKTSVYRPTRGGLKKVKES